MEHYATAQQVYVVALVFARVGAMVMTIPGLGEQPAPAQIRLSFALLLALVVAPVAAPHLGALPDTVGGLAGAVLKEVILGLMIGAILRMFLGALAAAGEIMAIQTSLSFAQTADPTQAANGSTLATFLSLLGVILVMSTDLHHMFIGAIAHSYVLFPVGKPVPVHDAANLAISTFSGSFALGVQLSAPILVFALVFNVATGLIGRAMPQFQIFFAATPLQVLLGLSIFALSLGVIGMVWVSRYRELLANFT
ncbi:flagellar biosynthetic protein FliR [Caulobacter sp. KR2-114]|uniref:flagellar biosynthetic protein FliR n=1 Tax=Caulobacter sp. KR2-114 TaxID=3400912 RepID=UPI003C078E08